MEELEAILAQMEADGRTEAEKRTIIKEWKVRNPGKIGAVGKLTGPASVTPTGGPNVMGSSSVPTFSGQPRANLETEFYDWEFDK